jgi:hypothetical protein
MLLLAASLAWVGGISLVVALFLGKGLAIGWIVAGALGFAMVVWLAVMFREVRRAIVLPDDSAAGEFDAVLARNVLDPAITVSRTGMDQLPVGRAGLHNRKAAPKSRRGSRSRAAASRNSPTDR